jgi:AAA domain
MNEPTTDDLLALFDELRRRRAATIGHVEGGEWEPPTPLVDWVEAYGCGDDPARWLAEPLLPVAGSAAIFAKSGTGKSLLALWLAAGLATGNGPAGPGEPIEVLYLDY